LIFERFLNPARREMPDIDMDFDERYRGEMIRYAAEKYGADRVAPIVTFSTIIRACVIGRVLGFSYAWVTASPACLRRSCRDATLEQCLNPPAAGAEDYIRDYYTNASGMREMYANDPEARLIDTARGLEGLRRQDSIHAAAVVISPDLLTSIVLIQRKGEDAEIARFTAPSATRAAQDHSSAVQPDDHRCLELNRHTAPVPTDGVALDDPAVYEMLARGDGMGVFQLEGSGMRALMRSLRPDRFQDLMALISLYRPGPLRAGTHNDYADRKNGRAPIQYPHPALSEVLAETYGIIVYQEQVMESARVMAGFLGGGRRHVAQGDGKDPSVMALQEIFVGVRRRGAPRAGGRCSP
jgi:DNA polymerase-3 subunit alpha